MRAKASELAAYLGGTLHGEDVAIEGAVSTDSREVESKGIYVARIGENLDGHRFLSAAAEAGAVLALVQYKVGVPITQIQVPDTTMALGKLAQFWVEKLRSRDKASLDVVGITGSVGKTSTKDLLARILASVGPTVANQRSYNNQVGMPLTALRADTDTRFLVCEMGADQVGDLSYLTSLVPLDVAVVLFVGSAHLGKFGSIDAIIKAKGELVSTLGSQGVPVLNYDDVNVRAMGGLAPGRVVYFSASGDSAADFYATDISLDPQGRACFSLHCAEGVVEVNLGLVGAHHVSNALAAIAAASVLGVEVRSAVSAISGAGAESPHRMNVFMKSGIRFLDDSYNANPDSVKAALSALSYLGPLQSGGKTVAVLGSMLELGADSDALHSQMGSFAASQGVDLLVTVGEPTLPAYASAKKSIEAVHFTSWEDARCHLMDFVDSGDTVLLKGSWGSNIWKIADELIEGMMLR